MRNELGPENLYSASLYTSPEEEAASILLDADQKDIFPQIIKAWTRRQTTSIRWRFYEILYVPIQPATTSFDTPHTLVCVEMTPTLHLEDDFNNWYDEEHILLLSQTPTWMESTRYRLITSNDDAPFYLAMHKWGSRSALGSPEHNVATSTPWRNKVVNAVITKQRAIFDYGCILYPNVTDVVPGQEAF